MKKWIAPTLMMVMVLCTACASATTVGICQLVQHEALDAATKGFKDALSAKMPDVKFDEQNASGDAVNCATIVNTFVSNGVDLIMANATPALQAASQATADIPVLGTSVTDYATALDMKNWTGKTGTNVSGTSDLAPLNEQAAIEAQAKGMEAVQMQRFLNDYSIRQAQQMLARWKQLAFHLIVKFNDMAVKPEENGQFTRSQYGLGATVKRPGYPQSFARRLIKEAGARYAVPETKKE